MDSNPTSRRVPAVLATGAIVVGLGLGSYGIASAASGDDENGASSTETAQRAGSPWGSQRDDETLLTGDTASKVEAAAVAEAGSGATVVRVETDADGNAAYEVHMTKSDGTPITVYVDESFDVVSVESR